MATDALIQKAIRIDFASSTVITIAHRINTIIDYDRVLVMSQGQVAEYDPDSVFTSMVNETGAQNAAHLRSLAGL
jgi:ATP-binding cassette subfamily C (CFTR/MRP) protein 1